MSEELFMVIMVLLLKLIDNPVAAENLSRSSFRALAPVTQALHMIKLSSEYCIVTQGQSSPNPI